MPDSSRRSVLGILLDQNIPFPVVAWLREYRKSWVVHHVNELGLAGKSDEYLYRFAQEKGLIVVTYDEDFADSRMYPLGKHHGIIRLRVWPTTIETTENALRRVIVQVPEMDWRGSLIIVDDNKIRIRKATA